MHNALHRGVGYNQELICNLNNDYYTSAAEDEESLCIYRTVSVAKKSNQALFIS